MQRLFLFTLLFVGCASTVIPTSPNLGVADSGIINQQVSGPKFGIPVKGAILTINLAQPTNVEIIYSISFSSFKEYSYVNALIDGQDGARNPGNSHHFAAVGRDEGDPELISATWVRIEQLNSGPHSFELRVDVDAKATVFIFRGQVRAIALGA